MVDNATEFPRPPQPTAHLHDRGTWTTPEISGTYWLPLGCQEFSWCRSLDWSGCATPSLNWPSPTTTPPERKILCKLQSHTLAFWFTYPFEIGDMHVSAKYEPESGLRRYGFDGTHRLLDGLDRWLLTCNVYNQSCLARGKIWCVGGSGSSMSGTLDNQKCWSRSTRFIEALFSHCLRENSGLQNAQEQKRHGDKKTKTWDTVFVSPTRTLGTRGSHISRHITVFF